MAIVPNIELLVIDIVRIEELLDRNLVGDFGAVGRSLCSVGHNRSGCLSFMILCRVWLIALASCCFGVAVSRKWVVVAIIARNYYMGFDKHFAVAFCFGKN